MPLIAALAASLLNPAWLALRGDWRSWTVAPPILTLRRQLPINRYPFTLLCAGLAILAVTPSLLFEALILRNIAVSKAYVERALARGA